MDLRVESKNGGIGDLFQVGSVLGDPGSAISIIHKATTALDLLVTFRESGVIVPNNGLAATMEIAAPTVSGIMLSTLESQVGSTLAKFTAARADNKRGWAFSKVSGNALVPVFQPTQQNLSARTFLDYLVGARNANGFSAGFNTASQVLICQRAAQAVYAVIPTSGTPSVSHKMTLNSFNDGSNNFAGSGTIVITGTGGAYGTTLAYATGDDVPTFVGMLQAALPGSQVAYDTGNNRLVITGLSASGSFDFNGTPGNSETVNVPGGLGMDLSAALGNPSPVASFSIGSLDWGE